MTKKSRRKNLSILLIPDDYADPLTFKISYKLLKVLGIISVIVIIHLLLGIVFYWRFAVVSKEKKELAKENIELRADHQRVQTMSKKVEELIQYQDRVKAAFGIKKGFEISDRQTTKLLNNIPASPKEIPENVPAQIVKKQVKGKLDFLFLNHTKSSYHVFAENIPTYLPVEGFLTTDFQDTDYLFPHQHLGLDIAAKKGTPVRAAADGIVLFANWTNDLGNLITIHHLNEFVTLYGHNQVLLKNELSTVKKGEIIALLGTSGQSTAPHLHFEIRKNGVPVDPKEYLISFQK